MNVVVYTGTPCFKCEARGSCRHRQVEEAPVIVQQSEKRDTHDRGQGKNFTRTRGRPKKWQGRL